MSTHPPPVFSPVSVLGLGPMGVALARALIGAGVPTTVWNRTHERAHPLADEGAAVAPDLAAAVAASDLVILCMRDHDAAREVLATLEPMAYDGRVVVNLSSSTPGEGRDSADWAAERGISYLNGAVMVPTPLIGSPDAVILYSGHRPTFEKARDRMRLLAGVADHLGEDAGRAALYDVAMLEIFFTTMTSFLHAAAMVTAHGVTAATFLPYARQMAELGAAEFAGLAANVDTDEHEGSQDSLEMELAALAHIVRTSNDAGLDGTLAGHLHDLTQRAADAGHGADSYSRVIDVLRRGVRPGIVTSNRS